MLIRKTQQPSSYPTNSIHDAYSTGTTDTYSCNYINGKDKKLFIQQTTSYTLQSSDWSYVKLKDFSIVYNNGGFTFSSNKVTINDANATYLKITLQVEWDAGVADATRGLVLYKNGSNIKHCYWTNKTSTERQSDIAIWFVPITNGDYFEFYKVLGGSGGTSTIVQSCALLELVN